MSFIGTLSSFCEAWYEIHIIAVGVAYFSLFFLGCGSGGGVLCTERSEEILIYQTKVLERSYRSAVRSCERLFL